MNFGSVRRPKGGKGGKDAAERAEPRPRAPKHDVEGRRVQVFFRANVYGRAQGAVFVCKWKKTCPLCCYNQAFRIKLSIGEGTTNAGFVKTSGENRDADGRKEPESKHRKTAKFLILIGSERASEILSRLEPGQVEAVSKEIASIKSIDRAEGEALLEEFRSLLASPFGFSGGVSGGLEAARRILYAAYGPEKGEEILVRAAPEAKANPFGFLEDFSGEQLALLFQDESSAVAALVFSRISPKLTAAVLAGLSGEKRAEIVRRIAHQAPVAPEVLEQSAAALKEKAHRLGSARIGGFDGMNTLAAILKSADASFGGRILSELETEDPELGKSLKDRIWTLDDIVYAPNLPIQKKLAAMENKEIVLLLKIPSLALRNKILSNLSQTRQADLLAEEDITGPVRKKEVDAAASAFLDWFRQSREEGSIIMAGDVDVVV